MLSSFKKIISKTPDLNEVQQNVFDTVQSLQATDLFTRFEFESKTGLGDNVLTSLGIFKLEPGDYSVVVRSLVECTFPSTPASITASLMLRYVNSSENLFDSFLSGINQVIGRGIYIREVPITSQGQTFELFGSIGTSGTITSRNLLNPSVTAFRRLL